MEDSIIDAVWKTESFASSAGILILYCASEKSESFTQYWYLNCLHCPNFSEFLELQKYDVNSDLYRLLSFRQILFLLHSLLILMNLWIVSGGMSHGEVGVQ